MMNLAVRTASLWSLSAVVVLLASTAWDALDAHSIAAATPTAAERLWFSELPPPGTPINLAALNAPPVVADGDSTIFVAGASQVCIFRNTDGSAIRITLPWGGANPGEIGIGAGFVTGGATPNFVAVPSTPGLPVRLFSGSSQLGQGLLPGYQSVTLGNFAFDNRAELVFAPAPGFGGPVLLLDGTGQQLDSFNPFGAGYTGGVTLGTLDMPGTPYDTLIVGRRTGSPEVVLVELIRRNLDIVFNEIGRGYAGDPMRTNGVDVAGGDVTGDGLADIVTAFDGQVRAFSIFPTVSVVAEFQPYGSGYTGGVRVAAGTINLKPTIVTGNGPGTVFSGRAFQFGGTNWANTWSDLLRQFGPSYRNGASVAKPICDTSAFATCP